MAWWYVWGIETISIIEVNLKGFFLNEDPLKKGDPFMGWLGLKFGMGGRFGVYKLISIVGANKKKGLG